MTTPSDEAVSVTLGEPRSRTELVLEAIALRHQIAVLKRSGTRRPSFRGNSGSEGVVTVDLVLTVQKPATTESAADAHQLRNGDTQRLIAEAINELSVEDTRNPSHVYARILRKAIQKHYMLDELHLGDVLLALRNAGYVVNRKTGLLAVSESAGKRRPKPSDDRGPSID